jgi:hypothetical protein
LSCRAPIASSSSLLGTWVGVQCSTGWGAGMTMLGMLFELV